MAANAPTPPSTGQPSAWAPVEAEEADNTHKLPQDISSFIAARLELASIEAQEAAAYTAGKIAKSVILALCAFFTWSLLLAGLTGALAPMADRWLTDKSSTLPGWVAILFVLALLRGIGALIFLGQLKKKPSSPLFELSRKEIELDKKWLTKNK